MAGSGELSGAMCCFCGQDVDWTECVRLVIYPPGESDGSQDVFCHASCLTSRLDPKVPYHPALERDDV